MKIKYLVLIFTFVLGLLNLGCSSLGYRSYACSKQFYSYSKVAGFLLQVGDCALFKSVSFETGDYYRDYKGWIDFEVQNYELGRKYAPERLENFGYAFNCEKDGLVPFAEMLLKKKLDIFGENYQNSARFVSLKIRSEIESDELLRSKCMK